MVVVEDDGDVGASVHREVGDTSLGLVEVEALHDVDVGAALQGFGHEGAEVEVAEGGFGGKSSLVLLAVLVVVFEFLAVEVAEALLEHGEHVAVFLVLRTKVAEEVGHVFAHAQGDVVGGFHALEPRPSAVGELLLGEFLLGGGDATVEQALVEEFAKRVALRRLVLCLKHPGRFLEEDFAEFLVLLKFAREGGFRAFLGVPSHDEFEQARHTLGDALGDAIGIERCRP